MPDNNTNLPILDDIIKPGNSDKAVHQPASKVQSSLWSDEEGNDASITGNDAETSTLAMDEPVQDEAPEDAEENRAPAIELPDLDVLTEEILFNMVPEIEQLLRVRIRQTLSRHLFGETGSD
jgi:hypothetical protein